MQGARSASRRDISLNNKTMAMEAPIDRQASRNIYRRAVFCCLLTVSLLDTALVFAQGVEDLQLLPPIDGPTITEDGIGPEDLGIPQEEPIYPGWSEPFYRFIGPLWEGSLEAGINGSEGTSQAFSIRTGGSLKRETEWNTFDINFNYGRNESDGLETQNNGLLTTRWDRKFANPSWVFYNRNQLEYDEFKVFDVRLTFATGLGYHWIKNDITTLTSRFGAAVSHEIGGPDDSWVPEANFGLDFSHKLTERQTVNLVVDYYPSWEDFQDYRLVTQADWEVLLDEATNLSLKLGSDRSLRQYAKRSQSERHQLLSNTPLEDLTGHARRQSKARVSRL